MLHDGWSCYGSPVGEQLPGIHCDFSTVSCNEDYVGFGTCGNSWAGDPPDQLLNPNSGGQNTIAQWFNPGWDASIFKNTKIGERINTQFRAEFFNALNNVNLAQGTP